MQFSPHTQNASIWNAIPLIERTKPPIVVAIDPPGDAAWQVAAISQLWVRHHQWQFDFNEGHVQYLVDTGVTPIAEANRFIAECKASDWYPHCFGILSPPAMARANLASTWWAIEFQRHCILNFGIDGKKFAVCGVSSQNDGYPFLGAEYYHCQEYQKGRFRYQQWFPIARALNPNAKLIISECGFTNLEAPLTHKATADAPHGDDIGYRGGYGVAPSFDYYDKMDEYLKVAARDSYVVGVALYGAGMNPDWATFEHLGHMEQLFDIRYEQNAPGGQEGPSGSESDAQDGAGTMPVSQEALNNALDIVWGTGRFLKGEQSLGGYTLPALGQQLQDAALVLKEAANPNP